MGSCGCMGQLTTAGHGATAGNILCPPLVWQAGRTSTAQVAVSSGPPIF